MAASHQLPAGVTQEMVQQGDTLFHGPGKCFKCHGADGKGTQKGPNLIPPKKWININGEYDEIVKVVTNGVADPKEHSSPMPSRTVAKLSEDDVRNVSAYVWSISR
jgi:mono/diheme cytochrome c family protein